MAREEDFDTRRELVVLLLDRVHADTHPSNSMMDLIEQLATPEEASAYAAVLMAKIQQATYPSMDMIRRITTRLIA